MSLLTRTGAHVGGKTQRRQSDRAKRVLSPCSSKVRLFSSSLGIGLPATRNMYPIQKLLETFGLFVFFFVFFFFFATTT